MTSAAIPHLPPFHFLSCLPAFTLSAHAPTCWRQRNAPSLLSSNSALTVMSARWASTAGPDRGVSGDTFTSPGCKHAGKDVTAKKQRGKGGAYDPGSIHTSHADKGGSGFHLWPLWITNLFLQDLSLTCVLKVKICVSLRWFRSGLVGRSASPMHSPFSCHPFLPCHPFWGLPCPPLRQQLGHQRGSQGALPGPALAPELK